MDSNEKVRKFMEDFTFLLAKYDYTAYSPSLNLISNCNQESFEIDYEYDGSKITYDILNVLKPFED